jgi:DNA-binding transcriptional LysR family regulator
MRSLNLDQLRALETVAELGSFTGAARRLNLSQSAISTQVKELEDRFEVRLVERLGKKAYATAAGLEVIEHARRIARESDAVSAAMRRRREGWLGRVRIGASTTALIYHLPPVLKKLRLDHPNIELVVTTGTTSGVVERMMRNEIDAGIVSMPIDARAMDVTPLCEEKLVAIFPADQKQIPKIATPESMREHPLILEYSRAQVKLITLEWLSRDGAQARPAMELDNVIAVKRLVAAGLGVSIVPDAVVSVMNEGIAVRPLEPVLTRTLVYIQRRHKAAEPALDIVRNALVSMLGKGQAGKSKSRRRKSLRPAK